MSGHNGGSPIEKVHEGKIDFFSPAGGRRKGGYGFITPIDELVREYIRTSRQGAGCGVFFRGTDCQAKDKFPPAPGQKPNTANSIASARKNTRVLFKLVKIKYKDPKKQFLAVQVNCLDDRPLSSS